MAYRMDQKTFGRLGLLPAIMIGLMTPQMVQAGRTARLSRHPVVSHAELVEAQRVAFWHRRGPAHQAGTDPAFAARQQEYWQSQMRGRMLCQTYGGCT